MKFQYNLNHGIVYWYFLSIHSYWWSCSWKIIVGYIVFAKGWKFPWQWCTFIPNTDRHFAKSLSTNKQKKNIVCWGNKIRIWYIGTNNSDVKEKMYKYIEIYSKLNFVIMLCDYTLMEYSFIVYLLVCVCIIGNYLNRRKKGCVIERARMVWSIKMWCCLTNE